VACGMPCAAGERQVVTVLLYYSYLQLGPLTDSWLSTSCRWSHDLPAYLQVKPADIHIPESLFSSPPFVSSSSLTPQSDNWDYIISQCSSASPTTRCPSFDELGECKHGYKCRFLGAHLQVVTVDGVMRLDLKVDASKKTADPAEYNGVDTDLLKSLRKREVSTLSQIIYF
jgi:tRNA-dihydrouridine synthase 3